MAVKDVGKSASYTDKYLISQNLARRDLWKFWTDHTPAGLYYKTSSFQAGEDPAVAEDDEFFVKIILAGDGGVQDFLFSDAGDKAANVDPAPATADERDGKFGRMSHSRYLTYLESLKPVEIKLAETSATVDYLYAAGEKISVPDTKIISFNEPGGIDIASKSKKGYYSWNLKSEIAKNKVFLLTTIHWDAALSSKSAASVLINRGLSTSYGVDNDGTIYQWLDFGKYKSAHGGTKANGASACSSDMSNAVYIKYQDWYKKNVGKPRPVIKAVVHGTSRSTTLLGMYRVQIVAQLRVLKAIAGFHKFPFIFPTDSNNKPVYKVYDDLFSKKYRGACTHMHITRNKWDVCALEDQVIVLLLLDSKLFEEFPSLVECFRLHDPGWQAWMDKLRNYYNWYWPSLGWV